MKKFQSVRNEEVVVELVSMQEDKITIQYESGEQKNISPATLKRWWKELPEEAASDEDDLDALRNTIQESNAGVSTEETQVEEPAQAAEDEAPKAVEEPKEKKSKAKKEKITGDHPLKQFIEATAIELDTEVFVPQSVPSFRSLKVNGKMYMAFTFNVKGVTLWLRSKALRPGVQYKKMSHMFDARIHFEADNQESRELIKGFIIDSLNYQKNK